MVETLNIISTFIKDVGFPIFVAIYVLARMEPAIEKLTEAIISLKVTLEKK